MGFIGLKGKDCLSITSGVEGQGVNQEQAVAGVEANTLALLIGMMVIVGITSKCGLFQYVAIKAA